MKKICILCDFDGTITLEDGLYQFIETYAQAGWEVVENLWATGKISSKECLIEEFNLIPNLSEKLISDFVKQVKIDSDFKNFYQAISSRNIDFYIVSDGIDYFIEKILKNFGLENVQMFSNHGEFDNGKFEITFPNDYSKCKNNAGTCKCKILFDLKKDYEKIIYRGDGVSDYCVADKADILYAKSRLAKYCQDKKLDFIKFETFKDINITG